MREPVYLQPGARMQPIVGKHHPVDKRKLLGTLAPSAKGERTKPEPVKRPGLPVMW